MDKKYPLDAGDLHDLHESDVKGSPCVRHIPCGSTFTSYRISYRHGRMQGLPLYCRKCGKTVDDEFEPVNDTARRQMIRIGVLPDPSKLAPQVACEF